jgi:hypothetical protein
MFLNWMNGGVEFSLAKATKNRPFDLSAIALATAEALAK